MDESFKTADIAISIIDDEAPSVDNKRKRKPNFNLKEKMELFTIISDKYKNILENKATDKCSAYDKDKCWDKVESHFNAVTTTGIFRDKDCLKRCYENRKREVRKLKAKERQESMKTGGGTPEKIILDAADEVLLEIMNLKSVIGLKNPYDSNSISDKLVQKNMKDDQNEYWLNTTDIEEEFPSFRKANDFKKPKHPALTPSYLSKRKMHGTIQKDLVEVYNLDSSRDETPEKLIPSIEICTGSGNLLDQTQHKLEEEKHTNNSLRGVRQVASEGRKSIKGVGTLHRIKNISNRRPGIQILSSSHIAKKYDELLDQRKVLLEKQIELANEDLIFNRTKNRIEFEILTLRLAREKTQK